MSASRTFLTLPGELRNHIYEYCIFPSLGNGHNTVEVWKILRRGNELKDEPAFNLALAFAQTCPILFAKKSIMLEALSFCLDACTFDFRRMQTHSIMVWQSYNFSELARQIRSVSIDSSHYLTANNRIPIPTSFEKTLSAFQRAFPKIEKLCVFLDENGAKPSMTAALKKSFANMHWPTLRKITIRRQDLEARARGERRPQLFNELFDLSSMDEVRSVLHTPPAYAFGPWYSNSLYNPFIPPLGMHMRRWALSWSLEMDFLWLERLNEDVDEILRKVNRLEEEDPEEAGELAISSTMLNGS